MSFTEERLLSGHSAINPRLVECCNDGCLSGSFSHLHTGSLELIQSDHWVLGHLSYQRPFSPDCSVWPGGSRRVLVVPNFFHLRIMEATVLLGTFNAADFFVAFSRSVPRHNPVSELCRQFLRPHGLVFALICIVSCETLYRQMYAFPNHIQSIEFTTGGLQSRCRNKDDQR